MRGKHIDAMAAAAAAVKRRNSQKYANTNDGNPRQDQNIVINNDNNNNDVTVEEAAITITFVGLPTDLMCNCLQFLDVTTLLRMRTINTSFRDIASQNEAGWTDLCKRLWKTKIHILKAAKERNLEDDDSSMMTAYRLALVDGRTRQHVTREEFIYNPETNKGTIWSFRFKEAAGPDWTSWDPWFNGNKCRKMVFLQDGCVKQYTEQQQHKSDNDDQEHGDNGNNDTQIEVGNDGDDSHDSLNGTLSEISFVRQQQQEALLNDPPVSMAWRFCTQPLDFPRREQEGSYIRLTVAGRDVPTYVVRRSPTNNWGFILESCWGIYSSFELPPKRQPLLPNNQHQARQHPPPPLQRRRSRRVLRRAHDSFGNWHNVEVFVDDDDFSGQQQQEEDLDLDCLLVDEEHFQVTSGLQWREAFLYNFGARTLPEGPEALADFERTYGAAMDV